jgi:cyclic pyranopterin monophosphate synthase
MRDISHKQTSLRSAHAKARICVTPSIIARLKNNEIPKGDPRQAATIAAIQAAKNTWQIIPHCHQIPLDYVGVEFKLDEDSIEISTHVKAIHKTGVEMEALTAASVAALTVYDMVKFLDQEVIIEAITLVSKKGGKSDFKKSSKHSLKAAVIVMSDSIAKGEKEDKSGKAAVERLKEEGFKIEEYKIIPDDEADIVQTVRKLSDAHVDLIIMSGGTGLGPRDITPEALAKVIERTVPGIEEAIRNYGQARNQFAMLSRSTVGMRKKTLIVSLPGSIAGVQEGLNAIFPAVLHLFEVVAGDNQAHPAISSHSAK